MTVRKLLASAILLASGVGLTPVRTQGPRRQASEHLAQHWVYLSQGDTPITPKLASNGQIVTSEASFCWP